MTFIDCLDRFHPRAVEEKRVKILSDGRGPFRKRSIPISAELQTAVKRFSSGKNFFRYGIEPDWFREDLRTFTNPQPSEYPTNHEQSNPERLQQNGIEYSSHIKSGYLQYRRKPDLILVTSLMTYWASGVRETISAIKEIFPDVPVVLGGIYATLCTDHAIQNSLADEVVTGRGEGQLHGIIKKYTGFSLTVETESDPFHISAADEPALNSGKLDLLPFPALDLISHLTYVPILTSRGCPFSCTYCASSFLEPKLRQRSPESVFQEICHWHEKYGVRNIAFYDDALLINPEKYILPLLEKILQYCQSNQSQLSATSSCPNNHPSAQPSSRFSFHTPNALHIRQITKDVAEMMFKTGFQTIRLGLETTDFSISRREDIKVKEDEFYHAVAMLKQAGFQRGQIGAYLLCALPGQNLDDVERSIALVKLTGIMPVLAYYTPIPHTQMWKEALNHSKLNLEKEPLFTNNALLPCLNNEHEIKKISELKKMTK